MNKLNTRLALSKIHRSTKWRLALASRTRQRNKRTPLVLYGWMTGFEPATARSTILNSTPELHPPYIANVPEIVYHNSMIDDNTAIMGKKVFFLHPSAFVQNSIIEDLIQHEFEIYLIKDEVKILKIFKKYPSSVVFACIDEKLTPHQWQTWVKQIVEGASTQNIEIGIISNTGNDEVRQQYMGAYRLSCGYIPLKADKDRTIKTILDALTAIEAKGRRKYLRTNTRGESKATINLPMGDSFITGEILDISVVGLSCFFSSDISLKKNTLFSNIQIKLQSMLLKVEGIIFGSREEGNKTIYVVLFSTKIDSTIRAKIRTFIQKRLQSDMNEELQ